MIHIDGSYGEGGGQILRTALALSMITQTSFSMDNIRSGRSDAGLKQQHLTAIRALEAMSNARSSPVAVGSSSVSFTPGMISKKSVEIDIGTAGSISLLLQSLLLPLMLAGHKTKLSIRGGTDVSWSPQIDYVQDVVLPQLQRYAEVGLKIEKRGYYPKGGGSVAVLVQPRWTTETIRQAAPLILLEQGRLVHVRGVSHASQDLEDARVAERQAHSAQAALSHRLDCPVTIRSEYHTTPSIGSGITLVAVFSDREDEVNVQHPVRLGADVLGEKGVPAEDVGRRAAEKLLESISSGAPVDEHLADHLIPLMGLVEGEMMVSKVTKHVETNIYVTEKFLDVKFTVEGRKISVE
ncbi:RNA 3'-terminal phosphate cyclase [Candidatus Woesearchaeota archaeon]|nr:RNA 3'-terminal phosphate cyclase [Candidatus Woesearchaeota archaeon]